MSVYGRKGNRQGGELCREVDFCKNVREGERKRVLGKVAGSETGQKAVKTRKVIGTWPRSKQKRIGFDVERE